MNSLEAEYYLTEHAVRLIFALSIAHKRTSAYARARVCVEGQLSSKVMVNVIMLK